MKQDSQVRNLEDLILILGSFGFIRKNQTQYNAIFYQPNTRRLVSVPINQETIPLGTLKYIIRQADITVPNLVRSAAGIFGINNTFALNLIVIIIIILANLLVSIPSHIYGISGLLMAPIVYLLHLFLDRPTPPRVAILAFKVRTIFVLFILPVILYLYVWKPAAFVFFAWMAIYLLIRISSSYVKHDNYVWTQKWEKMDAFVNNVRGYRIKYNFYVLTLILILNILSLFLGYHFGGTKGLWLGIAFSIITWLLGNFTKEIEVIKPIDDNGTKIK